MPYTGTKDVPEWRIYNINYKQGGQEKMKADYLTRKLGEAKPLIEMLGKFPEAYKLHSKFADGISPTGQWNGHALESLMKDVNRGIQNKTFEFTTESKEVYENAKEALKSVGWAAENEVGFNPIRQKQYEKYLENITREY